MRWSAAIMSAVIAVTGCLEATTGIRDDDSGVNPLGWESFSVAAIKAAGVGRTSAFFMARADSAFRMGLLHRPAGTTLDLTTHRDNAVYYVSAGAAELRIAGDTVPLSPGTVVFVPGETEHRIVDVTAELDVVVYLARGLSVPAEPDVQSFEADELMSGTPDRSEWRPLVVSSTLGVGVYTLPKGSGGDDGFTHSFDEYRLVMEGGGRFDVGEGGIEATPGSIVLIPDEVRHQFRRVSEDLAVLVVWKR